VLGDPSSLPAHLSYPLDNLETSRIESRAVGDVLLHISLSSRLRALTLHVGYTKSDSASTFMHMILSRLKECSALERLSVRGHSSACLQTPLGALTTLYSLSLHLSSLTEQTFMAVSALPLLADLDVHADHLSLDHLAATLAEHRDSIAFFPSLQKLKIRAEPGLLALLCRYLPQDKLHSLHIDTTGLSLPSAWAAPLRAIATVASQLHDFTLEHSITINESEDTLTYPVDKFFTIDHFRPLSKLPLRRFVLDSSLPPDFSDADVEEMAKWWPLLDRLDLGALTALENTEATWKPRISFASLSTLAKGCKGLRSLIIALDADPLAVLPAPEPMPQGSHPLASLLISSRSRPDTSSLSAMLSNFEDGRLGAWSGKCRSSHTCRTVLAVIVECHLRKKMVRRNTVEGVTSNRTYEDTGTTLSSGTFTAKTLDLAIRVDLVVLQDRHLDLLALVLDLFGSLKWQHVRIGYAEVTYAKRTL
jgi:hypothetical protein